MELELLPAKVKVESVQSLAGILMVSGVPEPEEESVPPEGVIFAPLKAVDEDQLSLPREPEASPRVIEHVQLPSLFCGQVMVPLGLTVICGAAHDQVALTVPPPETRKSRLVLVGQTVSGIVIVTDVC